MRREPQLITPSREFTAPVRVTTRPPARDFTARFKVMSPARACEFKVQLGGDPVADLMALLREVWVGWHDVVDADDRPLPFSAAERDLMLADEVVARAVSTAYAQAIERVLW